MSDDEERHRPAFSTLAAPQKLGDSSDEDSHVANATNSAERIHQLRRNERKRNIRHESQSHREPKKGRYNDWKEQSGSSDDGEARDQEDNNVGSSADRSSVAAKLLAKMGHREGEGLGKHGQGRAEPIPLSTQRGRLGLGHEANRQIGRDFSARWDPSQETKAVEEEVDWMQCDDALRKSFLDQLVERAASNPSAWMTEGARKNRIEDETLYCDGDILTAMLEAKNVFDNLNDRELREARTRANPYETIGGAFFLNRAAMKAANIDAVTGWALSQEDESNLLAKNPLGGAKSAENASRKEPLFYFADVCAGPGGFSEYMLWRKGFYNAKGIGFTLKGGDDFKLERFSASSASFFEPYYGVADDGDVTKPENIDSLEQFIKKSTDDVGVHLMMADGGFSVEGQENLQEVLSKRLYLCQLLVSLCIVRDGGFHFCKLFDIFTPFSVGLVYLMYMVYDSIALHKPHTSRPANSERYILCRGLNAERAAIVRDYLKAVNRRLGELVNTAEDVLEIVPRDLLDLDQSFVGYIRQHNENFAERQRVYLDKYRVFAQNASQIDHDQADLRQKCMEYWKIPDKRKPMNRRSCFSLPEVMARYEIWDNMFTPSSLGGRHPAFNRKIAEELLSTHTPREICHLAYRAQLLAGGSLPRAQPQLLVVTRFQTVLLLDDRQVENVSGVRLPQDTILLVERVTSYKMENKKLHRSSAVLRILDAAIIADDQVWKLPFTDRMAAVDKMLEAAKVVDTTHGGGNARQNQNGIAMAVQSAAVWKLSDLDKMRNTLSVITRDGSKMVALEENGRLFLVPGMRIVRELQDPWIWCWSSSRQQPYVFNKNNGKSDPLTDGQLQEEHSVPFWKSATVQTTRPQSWLWSWSFSHEDDYLADTVLKEPQHATMPTIEWLVAKAKGNQTHAETSR